MTQSQLSDIFKALTVGDLRALLDGLPDDMECGRMTDGYYQVIEPIRAPMVVEVNMHPERDGKFTTTRGEPSGLKVLLF